MSSLSDLKVRLDSRKKVSPAVFSENMKLREETHHLGMSFSPGAPCSCWDSTAPLLAEEMVAGCI